MFSFLRWGDDGSVLACVANFSAIPHEGYRIGLPFAGRWDEVLNTDAEAYVGSGVGNLGGVDAGGEGWHGQPRLGHPAGAAPGHGLAPAQPAGLSRRPSMAVRLVYETHATTIDNEAGRVTGWQPGELSAAGRGERPRPRPPAPRRRHRPGGHSDLHRAVQTVDIAFAGSSWPAAPTRGCGSATSAS